MYVVSPFSLVRCSAYDRVAQVADVVIHQCFLSPHGDSFVVKSWTKPLASWYECNRALHSPRCVALKCFWTRTIVSGISVHPYEQQRCHCCVFFCSRTFDSTPAIEGRTFDRCSQGGLILGPWKLYYGPGGTAANESCQFCWWDGEQYPNASQPYANLTFDPFQCPDGGCLFNIIDDPTEHNEVSAEYPGP